MQFMNTGTRKAAGHSGGRAEIPWMMGCSTTTLSWRRTLAILPQNIGMNSERCRLFHSRTTTRIQMI